MARATHPRRAVAGAMQIRLETALTGEEYVRRRAWRYARPPACPWHGAECKLAWHGTYQRRRPKGARVRRFRCRRSGRTVSLLPDCLAAHLSGTLPEVEATVRAAEQAPTLAAAVEKARPTGGGARAAKDWVRRRLRRVRACLELLRTLEPDRYGPVAPTLEAFGAALGTVAVLVRLRTVEAARLDKLPAPVGFRAARNQAAGAAPAKQPHKTGLDPPKRFSRVGASGTQPPPV